MQTCNLFVELINKVNELETKLKVMEENKLPSTPVSDEHLKNLIVDVIKQHGYMTEADVETHLEEFDFEKRIKSYIEDDYDLDYKLREFVDEDKVNDLITEYMEAPETIGEIADKVKDKIDVVDDVIDTIRERLQG